MPIPHDPSQLQDLSYEPLLHIIQATFNTSNENEFIEAFERYQTKLNLDGTWGNIHEAERLIEHVTTHDWVQSADLVMQWAKPQYHTLWDKGIKASTSTQMMDVFLGHAPTLTAKWLGFVAHQLRPKMFAHCFATFLDRMPQHETTRSDKEIAEVLHALVWGSDIDHVEAIVAHLNDTEATATLFLAVERNQWGIIDLLYTVERSDQVLKDIQSSGRNREGLSQRGVNYLNVLRQRSFDRQELIDEVHELGTSHKRPSKL